MAFAFQHALSLLTFFSFFLVNPSSCFITRKLLNTSDSRSGSDWSPAVATWYGSPTGAGSDGGACGYGSAVGQPPFSAMVSAGGPPLFASGKGCGACYEVRCTGKPTCSGKPVRVVITDECPECGSQDRVHFDLSGTAFGAMALSGQGQQLRDAGILQIQYRRVECNYPRLSVAFHVDAGSSEYYFASLIEYVDEDGELSKVELEQANGSNSWLNMQRSWGALWKLNAGSPLKAPFSIRLTSQSGKSIVANGVIPAGWKPGQTYRSVVNF